jgi:hypothetical protein
MNNHLNPSVKTDGKEYSTNFAYIFIHSVILCRSLQRTDYELKIPSGL